MAAGRGVAVVGWALLALKALATPGMDASAQVRLIFAGLEHARACHDAAAHLPAFLEAAKPIDAQVIAIFSQAVQRNELESGAAGPDVRLYMLHVVSVWALSLLPVAACCPEPPPAFLEAVGPPSGEHPMGHGAHRLLALADACEDLMRWMTGRGAASSNVSPSAASRYERLFTDGEAARLRLIQMVLAIAAPPSTHCPNAADGKRHIRWLQDGARVRRGIGEGAAESNAKRVVAEAREVLSNTPGPEHATQGEGAVEAIEAANRLSFLCFDPSVPDALRGAASKTLAALYPEGEYAYQLLLGLRALETARLNPASMFLSTALEAVAPAEREALQLVVDRLAILRTEHTTAVEFRDRSEEENVRLALRPELSFFSDCADAIARRHKLSANHHRVFLATDNVVVGRHVLALLRGRGVWNQDISTRQNGFYEQLDDRNQTRDAYVDLIMLSRTRYLVGTAMSTYSMLAAGLHEHRRHFMVYPTLLERCVVTSSPLASHSTLEWTPSGHSVGWSVLQTKAGGPIPCLGTELINALQALGGVYNPFTEPGILFVDDNRTDDQRAPSLLMRNALGPEDEEASRVRALLDTYRQQLGSITAGSDVRVLYALDYCNNIGNRALNLVAYVLLALASNRVLAVDPSWLEGFHLPLAIGVDDLPEPHRSDVMALTRGRTRKRTHWVETEPGFCGDNLGSACAGASRVCLPGEHGAPHPLHVAASPELRNWYRDTIGYTGAGLREIFRASMRPRTDLEEEAARRETALCGAVRGCEVGLHLRRGRIHNDYYFPEDFRTVPMATWTPPGPPSEGAAMPLHDEP